MSKKIIMVKTLGEKSMNFYNEWFSEFERVDQWIDPDHNIKVQANTLKPGMRIKSVGGYRRVIGVMEADGTNLFKRWKELVAKLNELFPDELGKRYIDIDDDEDDDTPVATEPAAGQETPECEPYTNPDARVGYDDEDDEEDEDDEGDHFLSNITDLVAVKYIDLNTIPNRVVYSLYKADSTFETPSGEVITATQLVSGVRFTNVYGIGKVLGSYQLCGNIDKTVISQEEMDKKIPGEFIPTSILAIAFKVVTNDNEYRMAIAKHDDEFKLLKNGEKLYAGYANIGDRVWIKPDIQGEIVGLLEYEIEMITEDSLRIIANELDEKFPGDIPAEDNLGYQGDPDDPDEMSDEEFAELVNQMMKKKEAKPTEEESAEDEPAETSKVLENMLDAMEVTPEMCGKMFRKLAKLSVKMGAYSKLCEETACKGRLSVNNRYYRKLLAVSGQMIMLMDFLMLTDKSVATADHLAMYNAGTNMMHALLAKWSAEYIKKGAK